MIRLFAKRGYTWGKMGERAKWLTGDSAIRNKQMFVMIPPTTVVGDDIPRIRAPANESAISVAHSSLRPPESRGNTAAVSGFIPSLPGSGLRVRCKGLVSIHSSRRIGYLPIAAGPGAAQGLLRARRVAASCGIGNGRLACWPSENPSGRSAHLPSFLLFEGRGRATQKRVLVPARMLSDGAQLRP